MRHETEATSMEMHYPKFVTIGAASGRIAYFGEWLGELYQVVRQVAFLLGISG